MKALIGVFSVALLLSGCGKSTEEICKETNSILAQATGEGFADVGWIGCLKQSPADAQRTLDGAKQALAAKGIGTPKLKSHDEMKEFAVNQDPFAVVYKLGIPSDAMFIPKDANGNTYSYKAKFGNVDVDNMVTFEYSDFPKAKPEQRSPEAFSTIQGKLATKAEGIYRFVWNRPLTSGLFGIEDEYFTLSFDIKQGKVINHNLGFPQHLWQKWF